MKHLIDIQGLPKGWKAVAYRTPRVGECFLSNDNPPVVMYDSLNSYGIPAIIVKKIKPQRIVLEETDEDNNYDSINRVYYAQWIGDICLKNKEKIWREVKEGE